MRTIEKIKEKIFRIKSEPFELSRYDRIAALNVELIQAQDERIKKLEAELAERKKDWQAVCAVMKGRNKYKKYAGLWKEVDHADY